MTPSIDLALFAQLITNIRDMATPHETVNLEASYLFMLAIELDHAAAEVRDLRATVLQLQTEIQNLKAERKGVRAYRPPQYNYGASSDNEEG